MGSSHAARLANLLGKNGGNTSPDLKVALARLTVETKERLTHGSPDAKPFFSAAVRELGRIRGITHAELRATCLFDAAHYFYNSGFPDAAAEAAACTTALARQAKLRTWERKGETISGVVQADADNVPAAMMHYARALELSRELSDRTAESVVLLDLGVALNYSGLFREAIPCFLRSLEIAKDIESSSWHLRPLSGNLAQCYLYCEEFGASLKHLEEAMKYCVGPLQNGGDALGRTIVGVTGVQVCAELQDHARARVFRDLSEASSQWNSSHRASLLALIAEGLFQVHFGRSAEGLRILENCHRQSADLRPVHRVALLALVKSHDTMGDPQAARRYIGELMNDFRKGRQESLEALMLRAELALRQRCDKSLAPLELREMRLRAEAAESELLNSRIEILERLAITADLREEASGEHGIRVGRLAFLLANRLGMSPLECQAMEIGARLHDVGKVAIPDKILLSSDELKGEERSRMRAHTVAGAEIVSRSSIPQLTVAEDIARYHHEWWNGNGYPTRLSGHRIPISARIVAIADVFDAMTHGRPYAPVQSIDTALNEVKSLSDSQFDPSLVRTFLEMMNGLKGKFSDFDNYLTAKARTSPFVQARSRIRKLMEPAEPGRTVQ